MKKTMFITSVIMVVVLAIALTTSSLAWFSAGGATTVGTAEIEVNAVTAQAVGAGLQIRKSMEGGAWLTSVPINLESVSALWPACPLVDPSATGVTMNSNTNPRPTSIAAPAFRAALNSAMWRNTTYVSSNGVTSTEYFKGIPVLSPAHHDTFYIRNSGTTSSVIDITINAAVKTHSELGAASDCTMWVALFDVINTAGANETPVYTYQLLGLTSAGADTAMTLATSIAQLGGQYWDDDNDGETPEVLKALDDQEADAISGANGVDTSAFPVSTLTLAGGNPDAAEVAGPTHQLEFFVWLDGQNIYSGNRDTVFEIDFQFALHTGS